MSLLDRYPSVPYVAPFAVFLALLSGLPMVGLPPREQSLVRAGTLLLVIGLVARPLLRVDFIRPSASVALGVAVFLVWIGPDLVFPHYRSHWLFQNGLTGNLESSVALESRTDAVVIAIRLLRGVLIVPIVEELFWRGWLPRWMERPDDFREVPLGHYTASAFWATTALFAVEHGAFWDVGLAAGAGYNWWMRKTRSLGDLMLSHAATNACLGMYVIATGRWEYW